MLPWCSPLHTHTHTHAPTATLPEAADTQQLPAPGSSNRTFPALRPSPARSTWMSRRKAAQAVRARPPRRLPPTGHRAGVTPLGGSGGRPRRRLSRRRPEREEARRCLNLALPFPRAPARPGAGGGKRNPRRPEPTLTSALLSVAAGRTSGRGEGRRRPRRCRACHRAPEHKSPAG